MKYQLRNFQNNFQILNSVGWIFVIVSIVFIVVKQNLGYLIFGVFGAAMIWLQLKGKIVSVDTSKKIIKSGGKTHQILSPVQLYMNEVKVSQNVNSRAQTANIKTFFYKAYLQDGNESILLSSNRKETRDLERLKAIAKDLNIEFSQNY